MTSKGHEEDWVQQLLLAEPRLSRVTEEGLAKALEGFRLPAVREMTWLTKATKVALKFALTPVGEGSDAQENKVTKRELSQAATSAEKLWKLLADRSEAADNAVHAYGNFIWSNPPVGLTGDSPVYQSFQDAIDRLDQLAGLLRGASASLEQQSANWKRTIDKDERIRRAHALSPIFELAFDAPATVNAWEDAASLGAWPDFYQRIVALAFGERHVHDLVGVLKEARRRHKADRVIFDPIFGIE